ncbi:MAG: peptidase MA family metallohydrolase [Candidatus Promineifilaceae bacterium]
MSERLATTRPDVGHLRIGLLCLGLAVWLAAARPGAAQALLRAESAAEYDFGQVMRFRLSAGAERPIVAATLLVSAPDLPNTLTADPEFTPGREIELEHRLDLTEHRLAPFSYVSYWWQLRLEGGEEVEVPARTLEYADDQFDWRTLERDSLQVRWAGPDAELGGLAMDTLAKALASVQTLIPVEPPLPLRVYVYPSANELRAALRLSGRDWIGAHARPELGLILVAASNPRTAAADLAKDLPHELSHLLLYRAVGTNYANTPRWLDEGLASLFDGQANGTYAAVLEEAAAAGATLPFSQLCRAFPAGSDQALLAYAQSESLVHFIKAEYGNQALTSMVAALADGADCEGVSRRALGVSLAELNETWLGQIAPQPSLARFWREAAVWLLLAVAGFGLTALFVLSPTRKSDGESGT